MDLGLKDKVVICMSSAAGIGKGIAKEMAREGAKVVICTAEAFKEDLENAQAEIEKETGNRPYTFIYDVKDSASITKMINDVAEQLGGVYALVNHCPGPKAATFENLTEEDWADGYEKCLHSYVHAIRAALPYMKAAGTARDCVSFPQKRYQTVEEYGRMATFLCSPANSAVSGQYLLVDGAMTTAY